MAILAVETKMIDALRDASALRAEGTSRKPVMVDSLPGNWDDQMLREFLASPPALLTSFDGGTVGDAGSAIVKSKWIVYVVTAHASGQAARRRGDALQAGAYELLELVVVPALHCLVIEDVGTLMLESIENVWTGQVERQGLAVYAAVFALQMDLTAKPAESELTPFETFFAQYDVPPHESDAQHRRWLVADYGTSTPDAKDDVKPAQT